QSQKPATRPEEIMKRNGSSMHRRFGLEGFGLQRFGLLALAGCAAVWTAANAPARAADPYPITFQLNYPAAGFNAGFELAVKNGYYKDAGLDVKIEPGNGSQITAQLVAAGKVDLGFADSAPVMKLVSSGAKIKVLATILQGNPNQVTALTK